ncbi:hypothetical protein M413DRAFT_420070 [Hebeloma cylindrosporum]|uniref:Uncharacterized protein n=1 Tax=Hebeloma cylindrosporum TaxID=76867 RepID=A0A0C2YCJ0_HEBCY|nr:hypothetical protein M413DRAFT_420070 [Hebeloma cylindrosporum h7]
MRAILQLSFLRFTFLVIQHGDALHNVTVDDQDASISYFPQGSWYETDRGTLDAGGQHMLTSDPDAYATFTFKGVSIYFMSPLWPYLVNTAITLDDGPLVLLDLVDHNHVNTGAGTATVKSQIVAKATGLEYTEHTITISVGANQPYAIVDTLIYTTGTPDEHVSPPVGIPPTQFTPLSGSAASTTGSAPQKSASSLPPLSRTPTKANTLAVVLSIVLLIFALFLAIGIWWCLFFIRNYPYPPPGSPKPIDSTLDGLDPPNIPPYAYSIYSPWRFYEALRSLTHSPGREYPIEPVEEIEQTQRQEAGLGTPALSDILLFSRDAREGSDEDKASAPRERAGDEEQWVYPTVPLAYVPTLRR